VIHHQKGDPSPLQANTPSTAQACIPQASSGDAGRAAWPVWVPDLRERWLRPAGMELPARRGLQHPHRGAPSSGSMATASHCCPEVPAPKSQPREPSSDDLASELNPHKPELKPHETAPRRRLRQNRPSGFPSRMSGSGRFQRMSWRAWPEGHPHDLETLGELFREGDPLVARDPSGRYYLESSALQDSNGRLDDDAAEALVRHMNGVARAAYRSFRPIHRGQLVWQGTVIDRPVSWNAIREAFAGRLACRCSDR